jgi:DNA-binding NarL/FixJ family response regulator
MYRIQVMLADDHDLMRQGLRALLQLEDNIAVIGEANSGEALLQQIDEGARPDIILMDVRMRGMSGIEATRQVKMRLPGTQVIGLTATEEDNIILEMLQAGACTYLVKSMAVHDLVKAIESAYRQTSALPVEIQYRLQRYLNRTHPLHNTYRATTPMPSLTRREKDVVKTLMLGHSNKEIARRLYISERTVQTHLSNIFSKMKVASRTEAVLSAMRDGWLMNH